MIDQKDADKYIADDVVVRSNIKLSTNIPIKENQPILQEANGL